MTEGCVQAVHVFRVIVTSIWVSTGRIELWHSYAFLRRGGLGWAVSIGNFNERRSRIYVIAIT